MVSEPHSPFYIEPDDVTSFGRELWKASDRLSEIHIDLVFAVGSKAIGTTPFGRSLARHSGEQNNAIGAAASELNQVGEIVKRAVEDHLRAEDESVASFRRLTDGVDRH